jgi:predicted lipoprotein with Yx(FWY)xxD motif
MASRRSPGASRGDGRSGGWRAARVRWRTVGLAVAVAACIAVVGCGGGSGGAGASGAPRYEVLARAIPGLGKVITDGQGFTLYMYVPDHRGVSRCAGVCARRWPPLVLPRGVTRPRAGPGVRAALLGTVRRGGELQETYNGWPLYLWQGDTAPGQATGQAEDMGLWYAMAVTGAVDKGVPS